MSHGLEKELFQIPLKKIKQTLTLVQYQQNKLIKIKINN